jgi:hypothetical protein
MSKRATTVLDLAARWRSIAINGTRPEPSATSSSGLAIVNAAGECAADGAAQLQLVRDAKHSRQVRRNLPSSIRSTVNATFALSGADAIAYERSAR